MHPIKLISSDFDGTLIGHGSDGRCSDAFARVLEAHRASGGLWAVNTGRGLYHAVEGLKRFAGPVEPDFLLTNEREVYHWDGRSAWMAYGEWNERCRQRHDELFDTARELFAIVEDLSRKRSGITVIYEEDRPIGLVTETEEIMEAVVTEIDRESVSFADFGYQRNTIYLRFCHRDYHKGSALEELSRLENIPASQIFAVGDHFNDIPMLDGKYAVMTACPANAIGPVKERVRLSSGYISVRPWADGVAEALRYFGEARSEVVGAGDQEK